MSFNCSVFKPLSRVAVLLCALLAASVSASAGTDIEKDIQKDLESSAVVVLKIKEKLKAGLLTAEEIAQLKAIAEGVRAGHIILEERFNARDAKVNSLTPKAAERHSEMKEGYLKALQEYLGLIETLSSQKSVVSSQKETLEKLKTLLDKIITKKKRPIHGTLPYKNLNYPAKEPSSAASITPAYKGGNMAVAPEDTQGTEEAPISVEISTLAQTLNWQPVEIYEYVKNSIETEWYYGCMKGAEETLHQKSGNDCDQATLLVALLRASGFPSRYVRGSMEFFAGGRDGKPIEKIKNLLGINDPLKIAEYLQKAGIPYKPIIQGGQIANFQIEHIWVESLIPYSNYRGIVIDDMGKTWLGLDTSIKVKDYVYNSPQDIFSGQWPVVGGQLAALRDEYLSTPSTTPAPPYQGGELLGYLKSRINTELQTQGSQLHYEDFLRSRTLTEEHMGILPPRIQHTLIKATNEYNSIPDELLHKVKITAFSGQQSAFSEPLFDITIPTLKLSNQKIALSYEPETVEDQEIINSYGGLDNTPAYLVRLRPVLKVNGERVVVAKDGLPMGADYNLSIELISPNGTEKTTSSHIVGNLLAIGITAGKANAPSLPLFAKVGEETAETILYKEAMNYIFRWNHAEDELASLFHLTIARPIPTVVTVGGVIDVAYLLDMPHGFEWKGLFMDAGLRRIETTPSSPALERQRLFMQISVLQGSVLEHKVFEDDLKVESVSTAKLLQLSNSMNSQLISIDKTNIDAILPTLPFDEAVKQDMRNAVNQNFELRTLNSELVYKDWKGIGYIKENPETGEAGYMLSGMIAGGMTAVDKLTWYMQDIANLLSEPYTAAPNTDPSEAVKIIRLNSTDYQSGTVGTRVMTPLQVIAQDRDGKLVKNVPVTFTAIAGGGELTGTDENGQPITGLTITVKTGWNGVAGAYLTLGKYTADAPYYAYGDPYYTLIGQNLISVSAQSGIGTIFTDKPFEAYGYPGEVSKITKTYGDGLASHPSTFSGTLVVKVTDEYDNPVSNKKVTFSVQTQQFLNSTPPTGETKNAKIFGKLEDCPGIATLDCTNAVPDANGTITYIEKTTDNSGALAYVILGNTDNTRYTIRAETQKNNTIINTDFSHFTWPLYRTGDNMTDPYLRLLSVQTVDEHGNLIDAGKPGSTFIKPITAAMYYIEEEHEAKSCGANCYNLKGKGTFTTTPVTNGTVNFTILQGGGSTNPSTQATNTNGQYSTTCTIGNDPAKNIIKATGTATIQIPRANQTTGVIESESKQFSAITGFEIWGVKGTLENSQLVLVNDDGYPTSDTLINYRIEPTGYKPQDIFIDIYEKDETGNERWYGFMQPDTTGKIILSKGGAKFDVNKTYTVELILNRGSNIEIRSEKTPISIGQMKMFTTDQPETEVEGAVTDGVTKLKLRLTVKNNSELAGAMWSISDPEIPASTVQRGTLLDGENPVATWPVTFDANGVAEAIYRVPETFVRFGTTEEANDKDMAERYLKVNLNSSNLANIRLKRPPVVLVHGLWSEPGTWDTFEPLLQGDDKRFIAVRADYSQGRNFHDTTKTYSNAGPLSLNYSAIEKYLNRALGKAGDQHLAATKVDIVTHSMGGLITREYCRQETLAGRNCKDQIHKFITIDTPHKGSELANLLVATTQQPDSNCYKKMLPEIERTDKKIWDDPQHTTIQGGLIDLSIGSLALNDLPQPPSDISFTSVYGIAMPLLFAHSSELNWLWTGLAYYCGKVPDASYPQLFGAYDAVFSETNDRIVSYTSEKGAAVQNIQIMAVDHLTVLQSADTVKQVNDILDKHQ